MSPPPAGTWPSSESSADHPWSRLKAAFESGEGAGTWRRVADLDAELAQAFAEVLPTAAEGREWLAQLKHRVARPVSMPRRAWRPTISLAETCLEFSDLRFDFLFDESRRLLAIGFNVTEHRRDIELL